MQSLTTLDDLRRRGGEDDDVGDLLVDDVAVALVDDQLVVPVQDVLAPDDVDQLVENAGRKRFIVRGNGHDRNGSGGRGEERGKRA